MEWLERTKLLLGESSVDLLCHSRIIVIGVGGVGAYAAEMLCRSGIGDITLVDADTIKESNINRQLPATTKTLGLNKTTEMAKRLQEINPDANITPIIKFIEADSIEELFADNKFDYVIDAIDSISPKVALITYCIKHQIPIVSSMGAGGRIDPSQIKYADISKTFECPLAKTMRDRLKKEGIYKGLPVVFSTEPVNKSSILEVFDERNKRSTLGTVSYLPAVFGCYLAAHVIKNLTK
ncbi:MAG: tRNA threonylcarbamoyladenosine dehydratase [Bacteroidia bacterium]|nr:tRNA threonylcarbamoyladenosine dehydratase [Bacteroidia bacterium]